MAIRLRLIQKGYDWQHEGEQQGQADHRQGFEGEGVRDRADEQTQARINDQQPPVRRVQFTS